MKSPLTIDEVMELMKRNARFEQQCIAQAKSELDSEANSGIDFISKVIKRAQEIKEQRKANGEKTC